MHRYLLDTNILADLIRNPNGSVAEKIAEVGETTVCTSIIVAAELRYGAEKSGSRSLRQRISLLLSAIDVVPVENGVDSQYAEIRHTLTKQGQLIGPNDLFIAAHARILKLTLVTANTREFLRVPKLEVENWLFDQA